MLILKPIAHETIWGGQTLSKYFSEKHNKIGHMYSLFDDKGTSNVIMNGKYKGISFHEYFSANKSRFRLEQFEQFPLILAIVEAADNLSIQVHPDDNAAKEIENVPYGKNESWYFLRAPKSGEIYNGSKIYSIEEIKKLIHSQQISKIPDTLKVAEGDYIYVAAGTLHAISAGALVYEIEENAEYTYRVYDFDRIDSTGNKRPLHVEQAIKSLKPNLKSIVQKYNGKEIVERLYSTKLFEDLDLYENNFGTLICLTVIDKSVDLDLDGVKLTFGMTVILEPKEKINLGGIKVISSRVNI